jgi:hypothetical protein
LSKIGLDTSFSHIEMYSLELFSCANDTHDLGQRLSYSSWRRHQPPVSLDYSQYLYHLI